MSEVKSVEDVKKAETGRGRTLRLLAQQTHRSKLVTVVIAGEELVAEVRSPDLQQRRAMQNAHRDDPAKQNMFGVIANTYEPGERREDGTRAPGTRKMFEPADIDVLMQDPSGGFIDTLSSAIGELLKEDMERAAGAAKK
jgi:hypothetical protein